MDSIFDKYFYSAEIETTKNHAFSLVFQFSNQINKFKFHISIHLFLHIELNELDPKFEVRFFICPSVTDVTPTFASATQNIRRLNSKYISHLYILVGFSFNSNHSFISQAN